VLTSISHQARAITLHVIEELLSRGVEPVQKNRILTKDVDTGPKASNKDFANGEIFPSSFESPVPSRIEDLHPGFGIKELGPQGRATISADTPIKTDDASDPLPRFMRLPKCF
jgi:hypothetical protein